MDVFGIIGLILTPITGVVSWLAGTRSRRNSVYQEMLSTIKTLSDQNKELHQDVVRLQDELIEVRRENAELKAGQEVMTRQMEELKSENAELRAIMVRGQKKVPAPKKQQKQQ